MIGGKSITLLLGIKIVCLQCQGQQINYHIKHKQKTKVDKTACIASLPKSDWRLRALWEEPPGAWNSFGHR